MCAVLREMVGWVAMQPTCAGPSFLMRLTANGSDVGAVKVHQGAKRVPRAVGRRRKGHCIELGRGVQADYQLRLLGCARGQPWRQSCHAAQPVVDAHWAGTRH